MKDLPKQVQDVLDKHPELHAEKDGNYFRLVDGDGRNVYLEVTTIESRELKFDPATGRWFESKPNLDDCFTSAKLAGNEIELGFEPWDEEFVDRFF